MTDQSDLKGTRTRQEVLEKAKELRDKYNNLFHEHYREGLNGKAIRAINKAAALQELIGYYE